MTAASRLRQRVVIATHPLAPCTRGVRPRAAQNPPVGARCAPESHAGAPRMRDGGTAAYDLRAMRRAYFFVPATSARMRSSSESPPPDVPDAAFEDAVFAGGLG